MEIISDIVKQEVNVKELQILSSEEASGMLVKQIKPNFKTLGPKYGKIMKQIAAKVAQFTQDDIASIESEGDILLEIDGQNVELLLEDFEIASKDIEGWLVASENGLTVALDIQISEDLKKEGIARELVNRIQNLRKDSGLEVSDRIHIFIQNQTDINQTVEIYKDYICNEVLADSLSIENEVKNGIEIEFDNINTVLSITKI